MTIVQVDEVKKDENDDFITQNNNNEEEINILKNIELLQSENKK